MRDSLGCPSECNQIPGGVLLNVSRHDLPSAATFTACPLLVKRVFSKRLFNGLSSATRMLNFCLPPADSEIGKGYLLVAEPGVEVLAPGISYVKSAELPDALDRDLRVGDARGSVGGVGREMPDDIRLLEKSPESAFRKGIVMDTVVPFPSPSEELRVKLFSL